MRLAALLAGTAASLYMTGVIWTVQIVHYALFDRVGAEGWRAYHRAHTGRMAWVVLLPMVIELGTAAVLVLAPPPGVPRLCLLIGLILTLLTWAVTFFVSVPLHDTLGRGWDTRAGDALVRTNWWRTALWTGRDAAMLAALWHLLRPG